MLFFYSYLPIDVHTARGLHFPEKYISSKTLSMGYISGYIKGFLNINKPIQITAITNKIEIILIMNKQKAFPITEMLFALNAF